MLHALPALSHRQLLMTCQFPMLLPHFAHAGHAKCGNKTEHSKVCGSDAVSIMTNASDGFGKNFLRYLTYTMLCATIDAKTYKTTFFNVATI